MFGDSMCRSVLAFVVLLATVNVAAQGRGVPQQIVFDAASSFTRVTDNATEFTRVRITQGGMRIEAERALTQAGSDFADSRWEFIGSVEIDIDNAQIRADAATLQFANYELVRAEVDGAPARFRDINAETGELTEGAARRFVYNLANQVIRFENDASIRNARNSVDGKLLRYDLARQSILFEGDADTGERVRITIQPPSDAGTRESLRDAGERAAAEAGEATDDDE